jgi:formylglycine-generating enzyme required for sulfatase activity
MGVGFPQTVPIPGGRLVIREEDGAARTVEIVPFRIGRTPVTNREYAPFLGEERVEPPPWWNDPAFSAPDQPVVGVSWHDAMAFCEWLSENTGGIWRLPTEHEWELAASGGLEAPKTAWGETIPAGEIPDGPIAGPWEAGRGTPNGYGLCDAGTIVHEWCRNRHEPREPGSPRNAPERRASRGGSWRHRIRWSSPSAKSSLRPDSRYSDYGFRVLRERDP